VPVAVDQMPLTRHLRVVTLPPRLFDIQLAGAVKIQLCDLTVAGWVAADPQTFRLKTAAREAVIDNAFPACSSNAMVCDGPTGEAIQIIVSPDFEREGDPMFSHW